MHPFVWGNVSLTIGTCLTEKKLSMLGGVTVVTIGFMSSVQDRPLWGMMLLHAANNLISRSTLWINKAKTSCLLVFRLSLDGPFVERLGTSLWTRRVIGTHTVLKGWWQWQGSGIGHMVSPRIGNRDLLQTSLKIKSRSCVFFSQLHILCITGVLDAPYTYKRSSWRCLQAVQS